MRASTLEIFTHVPNFSSLYFSRTTHMPEMKLVCISVEA